MAEQLSWQLHMENLHCDKIHFLISLDRIHCMTFLTCECVTLSDPTRDRMHSILKTPVTLQTSCGATPVQSCVLGLARWCAWSACVHHIWQSHRVTTSLQTTTTLQIRTTTSCQLAQKLDQHCTGKVITIVDMVEQMWHFKAVSMAQVPTAVSPVKMIFGEQPWKCTYQGKCAISRTL